jgi:ubiquinone/menaquinone biosynthesis C-methylase UbiE
MICAGPVCPKNRKLLVMSYAKAWLKWFDVIEAGAAPLSAKMIELADLDRAHDVLDVGTGIGEPAISAALALDSGGRILGVDRDPAMISIAYDRAKESGATNIDFTVADIETMSLGERDFDAILARWSLMFVGDTLGTFRKLAKSLRPGGRLVVAAWAAPGDVPALTLAKKAVHEHFGWPDSTYVVPRAFALSDTKATERTFFDAGFSNVSIEPFPVAFEFASSASFIQYRTDVAGPLWEGMENEPTHVKRAAFKAIENAMQIHRVSSGHYRLVNHAYCIAGRVSEAS